MNVHKTNLDPTVMPASAVRDPELIETLQRYADLFTFAPVGFLVMSEDSRVEDVNRAAASMLGWPRSWVAGQLFSRWVARGDVRRFLEHLRNACRSDEVLSDEFKIKDRRGRARDVRIDGVAMVARGQGAASPPGRCQLSITDLTEQRWANRDALSDVAHVVRLNASGEMAAALAHELSQPLGAITLYCKTTARSLRDGHVDAGEVAASLEKICEAAGHASATIRGLRSFLSKSEAQIETLELNDVVRDTTKLAAAYAKERGSKIELRLADNLPCARAARVHVQQVLLNLLQNSIDAMQEHGVDDRRVVVFSDRQRSGTLLRVTVADSGPGMTAQQRRRAFEPFYTTKKNGMGVGLSISRSIIESYGGRLWARQARRGTSLSFTLPANEHN